METINNIIAQSPAGLLPKWHKSFVLLLFALIITTLFFMLIALITYGSHMTIQYGY